VLKINYLNQITFGWLLGIWLASVFALIIRTPFYNYIKNLLEDRQEIPFLKNHIYCAAIISGLMMLSCVVEFLLVRNNEKTANRIDNTFKYYL